VRGWESQKVTDFRDSHFFPLDIYYIPLHPTVQHYLPPYLWITLLHNKVFDTKKTGTPLARSMSATVYGYCRVVREIYPRRPSIMAWLMREQLGALYYKPPGSPRNGTRLQCVQLDS